MINTRNPFVECPSCITDRQKLRAVLADYFPSQRLQINLLVTAYDSGVVALLERSSNIDNLVFTRIRKNLVDDFGLSEENATWATEYWINFYAGEVLRKVIDLPRQEKQTRTRATSRKTAKVEDQLPLKPKATPSVPKTSNYVVVAKMAQGEKVPKDMIDRKEADEQKLGIKSATMVARFDLSGDCFSWFKLTGEYEGKTTQYLLVMVMAYNEHGDLIGADFDYKIEDKFKGKKTFSISFRVPTDEHIARIAVRIIPDPVFLDW